MSNRHTKAYSEIVYWQYKSLPWLYKLQHDRPMWKWQCRVWDERKQNRRNLHLPVSSWITFNTTIDKDYTRLSWTVLHSTCNPFCNQSLERWRCSSYMINSLPGDDSLITLQTNRADTPSYQEVQQVFRVKKLMGRRWGTLNSHYLLVTVSTFVVSLSMDPLALEILQGASCKSSLNASGF